ncbi:MAG TPA: hypothetical protein VEI97_09835 [bacterium]|nr:hypothetical protein [bacterium]
MIVYRVVVTTREGEVEEYFERNTLAGVRKTFRHREKEGSTVRLWQVDFNVPGRGAAGLMHAIQRGILTIDWTKVEDLTTRDHRGWRSTGGYTNNGFIWRYRELPIIYRPPKVRERGEINILFGEADPTGAAPNHPFNPYWEGYCYACTAYHTPPFERNAACPGGLPGVEDPVCKECHQEENNPIHDAPDLQVQREGVIAP